MYCYSSMTFAVLTLGQVVFQAKQTIVCIIPRDHVQADSSISEQEAWCLWGSLILVMQFHCIMSGVALRLGQQFVSRSHMLLPLLIDIFLHTLSLVTLSNITAMPWSTPFAFTWPLRNGAFAFCLVVNPFRFLFPSFLMMAHEMVYLVMLISSPVTLH